MQTKNQARGALLDEPKEESLRYTGPDRAARRSPDGPANIWVLDIPAQVDATAFRVPDVEEARRILHAKGFEGGDEPRELELGVDVVPCMIYEGIVDSADINHTPTRRPIATPARLARAKSIPGR
jgi:hypothetical protein